MNPIKNHLTLAVAGSRKTQGIAEACRATQQNERVLVLTYTVANQKELQSRIRGLAGDKPNIDVKGWFSFLIGDFVRPFVPFLYLNARVRGFDFESLPQQGVNNSLYRKYFNRAGEVRKVHLPQLATLVEAASNGAGVRRLNRLYSKIYIDEVQDLCGYDLEILRLLIDSDIALEMVGDIRQAVLATNDREAKNSAFKYMRILKWFRQEERLGRLTIKQRCETWRCRPEIASFADSLFEENWGFEPTISLNQEATAHDGIFLVRSQDASIYAEKFHPLALRNDPRSGKSMTDINFTNIRLSKGLSSKHVLIYPTGPIADFLNKGIMLEPQQAARLYVAVTRAEQSVAFILDKAGDCRFTYWIPTD